MKISGSRFTFYILFLVIFIIFVLVLSFAKNATNDNSTPKITNLDSLAEEYLEIALTSPESAMQKLREESTTDTVILENCHRLAHEIGGAAFKTTNDFKKALTTQDPFCNSGYLHGVIESYFSSTPLTDELIQRTCEVSAPFRYEDWQCSHGIGHGVMYTNSENLAESITLCQTLKTADMTSACVNGVYMEYFNEEGFEKITGQNPISLCQTQPEEMRSDCFLYAPTAILFQNDYDYAKASEVCNDVDDEGKPYCFQGIGAEAMKKNLNNATLVDSICEQTSDYRNCITGATSYAYFHFGNGRPVGFICLLLSEKGQEICSEQRKNLSSMFGDNVQ